MLNQQEFFRNYLVWEDFEHSDLDWNTLEEIYDDYIQLEEDMERCCIELEQYWREGAKDIEVHSVRCRKKNPEHLIEKIIRKRGREQKRKYRGINKTNYREIVKDLIGMRILVISKEEWEVVFDRLSELFPYDSKARIHMIEPPTAYTRYGDRDIFKDKIYKEHTTRGYRSQHYIVRFGDFSCEIQVRTLAEEVSGEFDHWVKYPYRNDNKFLMRYTNMVSQLTNTIDEMISTCIQMGEEGWDRYGEEFARDGYMDWQHMAQREDPMAQWQEKQVPKGTEIDMASYGRDILLRRGR